MLTKFSFCLISCIVSRSDETGNFESEETLGRGRKESQVCVIFFYVKSFYLMKGVWGNPWFKLLIFDWWLNLSLVLILGCVQLTLLFCSKSWKNSLVAFTELNLRVSCSLMTFKRSCLSRTQFFDICLTVTLDNLTVIKTYWLLYNLTCIGATWASNNSGNINFLFNLLHGSLLTGSL